MNHRIYSKGFTLIELLVVISIIGLLSSVVLASVRVARDKGEIAAGQKFSGYNYRTLNANAVVSYNFNESNAAATPVSDLSGNGYGLTLQSCATTPFCRSSLSPTNGGYSLVLDGVNQFASFATSLSLSGATGVTISTWIYPTAIDSVVGEGIATFGSSADPDFLLSISNTSMLSAKILGVALFTSTAPITLNKWQHVSAVFNGSKIRLYINGRVVGESNAVASIPQSSTSLTVGRYGSVYYNGNIDDFAMYKEALSASEVFKLYAQGAKEHNLASNN